jgi:murein L,D-transpeptidase YafK
VLKLPSLAVAAALTLTLAACNDESYLPRNSRHYVPISQETQALMQQKGMKTHAPILMRAYKQESALEVWKQTAEGKFALLKTYPMCRWSGQLGPKVREGDRQVPEGFYAITPSQMNPNSNFYLSFNVGYPNSFDRAHGRTGSLIMVHGACSSMGCFSMTDDQIADLYALTREAFAGGQQAVQLQSMPFRMTAPNLAKFRADPNMAFWKNLKEGYDHFDVTKTEPKVAVCNRRYVFNATPLPGARFDAAGACPPVQRDSDIETLVAQKQRADEVKVAELVASGTKAVKRLYHDGDQHPVFKRTLTADGDEAVSASVRRAAARVAEISRPDAVMQGPVEIPVEDYKANRSRGRTPAQIAALAANERQAQQAAEAAAPAAAAAPAVAAAPVNATPRPAAVAAAPAAPPAARPSAVAARAAATPPIPAQAPVTALAEVQKQETQPFFQRVLGTVGLGPRVEAPTALSPAAAAPPAPR